MTACRLCDADGALERVLDLGHHPLADWFLAPAELAEPEITYPLALDRCACCGYVGTSYVVPAEDRYQAADYSYTADNSAMARAHFAELAETLGDRLALDDDDLAVDIGGNVGTLLDALHTFSGCSTINVEPALNIARIAEDRGVPTISRLWSFEIADLIVADHDGAAVIVATNVLNHASRPCAFVAAVARALRPGGTFVIEVPSLHELVARRAFDTVYLEHVSYFGLRQLERLLAGAGLGITHVETVEYMGGSLRVFARRGGAMGAPIPDDPPAEAWRELADYAASLRRDLVDRLYRVRALGGRVVGVGAAAKGNTLLNYCRIDRELVECVADASPHKIGKLTPGAHLPIIADGDIPAEATHALILPWNIADHLQQKLAPLGLEFIVPGRCP